MFSYNRYPYNCASVQRGLLAPEILNESFLKCRYFTALYGKRKTAVFRFSDFVRREKNELTVHTRTLSGIRIP